MIETPECDKMLAVQESAEAISGFMEWLTGDQSGDQGVILCRSSDRWDYLPIEESVDQLMARYFEIDMEKVERERRVMLEAMLEP